MKNRIKTKESLLQSHGYKSIIFVLLTLIAACNTEHGNVIAWVNDHPISRSEFKHWMLLERSEVHNYFYRNYNEADSENFWEKKIEVESPLEMLKRLALEKAVRCKVQQIIALDKGIVEHIDFDRMMEEMQEENLKRKRKIEQGEVVYGAKKYTERTFFAHEFDNMLLQLKSELSKKELKASDEQLKSLVENEDYPLEEYRGFYQLQHVENYYDGFIDSIVKTVDIKIDKQNWSSIKAFFN